MDTLPLLQGVVIERHKVLVQQQAVIEILVARDGIHLPMVCPILQIHADMKDSTSIVVLAVV